MFDPKLPKPRPVPKPEDYDRLTADEDAPDYEPTYRDGAAKHECWRDD